MSVPDGGLVLVLSFALLWARQPGSALAVGAAQGAALAALALTAGELPEAAAILLLNAGLVPLLLHRLPPARRIRAQAGLGVGLAAAGLTLLAAPVSEPLAVLLLGILLTAVTRDRATQVLGLLAMQNGIALAGLGLPVAERLAAILPLIPVLAWAALRAGQRRPA